MITTTTFEVPGHKIHKCLGMVQGVTVRVPSTKQSVSVSFKSFGGGKSKALTELCEAARKDAYDHMMEEAIKLGANAVVGVRYDASQVMGMASEVICYGTAVVVEFS